MGVTILHRSKDVIISGGEVVGCAEVEEAVVQALGMHRVAEVLAFAAPHSLMQVRVLAL